MLLHVRGATCFRDLKIVDGIEVNSFKEACSLLGLTSNDNEWELCLGEAIELKYPKQLRQLFGFILVFCNPVFPENLYSKFREFLFEDFLHKTGDADLSEKMALFEIKLYVEENNCSMETFGLRNIDKQEMPDFLDNNVDTNADISPALLNFEQKTVFDLIIQSIENPDSTKEKLFMLDGPAGTGKTFLYNCIITHLRTSGTQPIAVAFSGIAASLLINGRTVHSMFKLPIPLNKTSSCNVRNGSNDMSILMKAKLLIWDEITLSHVHAVSAVDRFLKDLFKSDEAFGGITVLFGGDFRQCLPVVKNGTNVDIKEACVKSFKHWSNFVQLRLKTSMRTLPDERKFQKWLSAIGNGNLDFVMVPSENRLSSVNELIERIFPKLYDPLAYSSAILCPRNDTALALNDVVVKRLQGEEKVYRSSDSLEEGSEEDFRSIPSEVLNSFLPSGMPPHLLRLKVGAIVMLLRNLNVSGGLCNGTRLVVRRLLERSILCEIVTGSKKGSNVIVPRIDLLSTESELPFILRRRQLPIRLAFAMTINKSQGQTLDRVGIDLNEPVFSHGQLYVAVSRARTLNSLCFFSKPSVPNIVFKDILSDE